MNKYLHAVGFAVGLVAVTLTSAVSSAFMTESTLLPAVEDRRVYAALWLASYLLSAVETGAYAVRKETRKRIFIPQLSLAFTALSFFFLYRMGAYVPAVAGFAVCAALKGVSLALLMKNARLSVAGVVLNIVWYFFMAEGVLLASILL